MNGTVNGTNVTNGTNILPVIVVHGGACNIPQHKIKPSEEGVKQAAIVGHKVLAAGGNCVDAVTAAVACLEDNPWFDAGRGSDLNADGEVEMHAMVMRGDTCDIGGVVSLKLIKNPIEAAKLVLYESHHCLLDGPASLKMAREHNLAEESPEYFVTEECRENWKNKSAYKNVIKDFFSSEDGHDTVGAVALDVHGNLACATSTGGIASQLPGRVSDSPLSGCGGFADNESAAVSTTGHGESIMKVNLARLIAMHVEHGLSPTAATTKALNHMRRRVTGNGGAISVDARGRIGVQHSTNHMTWARIGGMRNDDETPSNNVVEYGSNQTNGRQEKI
nr:isoaspartyl peptidase/L-asparaginase [Ciona intestinalis]|eukprot:XP_002121188.1 isoaspartyl peptidase/L-asparaginase [Ciona intestinalis]